MTVAGRRVAVELRSILESDTLSVDKRQTTNLLTSDGVYAYPWHRRPSGVDTLGAGQSDALQRRLPGQFVERMSRCSSTLADVVVYGRISTVELSRVGRVYAPVGSRDPVYNSLCC